MQNFSIQQLLLFSALLQGSCGLLFVVLFKYRQDASARYWLSGCFVLSLGFALRAGNFLAPALLMGLSSALALYAQVLCGYSLQALHRATPLKRGAMEVLVLVYGGAIWALQEWAGPVLAAQATALALTGSSVVLFYLSWACSRAAGHQFFRILAGVFLGSGLLWLMRLSTMPSDQVSMVSLPGLWNIALLTCFGVLRHVVYLAARFSGVQQENAFNLQANALLQTAMQEKDELLRTLTTSNKAVGLGALAGALAHELNQPLTAISIEAQLGLRELASPEPLPVDRLQTRLLRIKADVDRSAELMRKLRGMFSREKTQAGSAPLSLARLAEEVLPLVQPHAQRHGIQLVSRLDPAAWVLADRTQLHQVLLNLLTNACNALRQDLPARAAPRPAPILELEVQVMGDRVRLEVRDNGPGFPPGFALESQPAYLTPLSGIAAGGMGVGLWLSKKIVDMHRGTLTLANRASGGARVVVEFDVLPESRSDAVTQPVELSTLETQDMASATSRLMSTSAKAFELGWPLGPAVTSKVLS